jgi:hypothetical protein
MAMTSASFMGMGGYTTVLSSKLDKIDCSAILSAVLVADRQLLGHIKMGGTANNVEVNWIEDALIGATFDATGTVSASVSLIGMSVAQVTQMFRAKTLIKPVSSEDIYRVDALDGGSALEVTIYSSTTHVTHTTTQKWIVVGMPYSDIDAASSDISQSRSKRQNFTQVFERAVQITQSRKGIDMEAVVNELQMQIKYRTLEMKRELDIAVINGIASYDGTQKSGQSEWRTMQGIINYIRDYNMDNSNEDDLVSDVSGALTIGGLNDLLYDIWDAGGLDEMSDPIIAVGPAQQRIIAAWEKDIRRVEQGERQVGYYRDVFLSDMGQELPVVLDRWIPPDKLIILDRARVALRALSGDGWHAEKMAKTGRVEKWQLSGQYTIEVRNADKCHGLLMNLT